jgi:hypothetical protein
MKKVFLSMAVLFLMGLFISTQAQTQSGTFFFDSSTEHYTLDKNEGKRIVEKEAQKNFLF